MKSRFFLRIYLKLLKVLDIFFISVFNFLEKLGFIKPIAYKEFFSKNDIFKVNHAYPVNFKESDAPLFDEWKQYSTFENKLYIVNNVNVSSKGIVFKGFQCFVSALPHPVFKVDFGFLFIMGQYLIKKKVTLKSDEKYLLVFDLWSYANYFHWMVDSLCRLIEWEKILNEYTILLPENPPRYMLDTLNLLNIKNTKTFDKNIYLHIKNLHIPNYSAWSGQQNPLVLKKVRNFIITNIKDEMNFDYVYISRSAAKNRRVSNEVELIKIVEVKGFKIVRFEGMSLAEQVSIVKNAKVIITSHGANVTNALFSVNALVFELLRNDKSNFCYWSALSCLNFEYFYQLCIVVGHDDLLVDIELFKLNLQKILND